MGRRCFDLCVQQQKIDVGLAGGFADWFNVTTGLLTSGVSIEARCSTANNRVFGVQQAQGSGDETV